MYNNIYIYYYYYDDDDYYYLLYIYNRCVFDFVNPMSFALISPNGVFVAGVEGQGRRIERHRGSARKIPALVSLPSGKLT